MCYTEVSFTKIKCSEIRKLNKTYLEVEVWLGFSYIILGLRDQVPTQVLALPMLTCKYACNNWGRLSKYFCVSLISFDCLTQSSSIHVLSLIEFDWNSVQLGLVYYMGSVASNLQSHVCVNCHCCICHGKCKIVCLTVLLLIFWFLASKWEIRRSGSCKGNLNGSCLMLTCVYFCKRYFYRTKWSLCNF